MVSRRQAESAFVEPLLSLQELDGISPITFRTDALAYMARKVVTIGSGMNDDSLDALHDSDLLKLKHWYISSTVV